MTRLAAMIAGVLIANTLLAADSYLYWMVDPSASSTYEDYVYATVKIDDGSSSYLQMYDPGTEELLAGDAGTRLVKGDSGYFGAFDAASMSGASFLIELWSSAGEESIATATLAYSTAFASGAIYTPGASGGGATPYAVVVPEPTSGLLLLLGMAGLALRRKDVI